MRMRTNVAIIGAGTAGLAAYRAATAAGKRALLIEGGPHGTTCARVGCMPSKLLIAAADAAHAASRWPAFGLRLDGALVIDGRAVMARLKRERDRFVGFVLAGIEAIPATNRIEGYARFVDDHTLMVGGDTEITSDTVVIATGSSPKVPAAWRGLSERLIVNDDVFEWDELPRSVAVFGPGVIGLEIGQALHRLGVTVHLFGRQNHVGPFSDPVVRAYARETFMQEFSLDANADVKSLKRTESGVSIGLGSRDGVDRTIEVDYVVATIGRAPNVGKLGLERTSLKLDLRGVPLFDPTTLQAGSSSIFIAGDASDYSPLLHEAADEGKIAGENAARYPAVRIGVRRAPLSIVFTDPQIAVVGQPYSSLASGSFAIGAVSFEDQGRARVMLRNRGLLHIYADLKSGRFLGAEMIGPDAEHLAHLLAWAWQSEMTVTRMLEMPFYHPVIEEGLRTALSDAAKRVAEAQRSAGQPTVTVAAA